MGKLSFRLLLRASELTPFHLTGGNSRKTTKYFWIDLIRSQSPRRVDYYVATSKLGTLTETTSSPFKPFSITYNTNESANTSDSYDNLISRDYIPIRLSKSDLSIIDDLKCAAWKSIKIHVQTQFQALRIFGKHTKDLSLPTATLYSKKVYRDLDLHQPLEGPPVKASRLTPAQNFDVSQLSADIANNTANVNQPELKTNLNLRDSVDTTTILLPKPPVKPPTSIEQQLDTISNPMHVRKQRDFPLLNGWLKRPEFNHITSQLDAVQINPFPNIYLRMKINTNHVYHVYIRDLRILNNFSCVTVVDEQKMMHFAPIHAASERHALYKQFTGANTEKKGFGSWITLPHLPDLAFLSKTVPMREHLELIYDLKTECSK